MENHTKITPFGALVNQMYSGTFKSLNYISVFLGRGGVERRERD